MKIKTYFDNEHWLEREHFKEVFREAKLRRLEDIKYKLSSINGLTPVWKLQDPLIDLVDIVAELLNEQKEGK